jgi:hypothetical protein
VRRVHWNISFYAVITLLLWSTGYCVGSSLGEKNFPWPDPANGNVLVVPSVERTPVMQWDQAVEIESFFGESDGAAVALEATVQVMFSGGELLLKFSLPGANAIDEPRKCFLSDEPSLLGYGPCLSISLDPEHGHGVYYQFVTDPAGRKMDMRTFDESWSAQWTVSVDKASKRWEGVIAIPVAEISTAPSGGQIWGFNLTLHGGKGADAVSSTPIVLNLADAEAYGHLLFQGDLDPRRVERIKDDLAGFHRQARAEKLAANKAGCGPELAETGGELTELAVRKEYSLKGGRKITCVGLDNQPIVRSRYPFFYEKYENPELARLRRTFRLDEVVAPGRNEFEKLLLLNEWLVEHVPFGSPPPIRPNAFHVLNHGLNGQTFFCTYLSFALTEMYASLGWTARKLTSVGHGTLDVWSNYWCKWIQIDPSRNSHFRMRGTAVPLNSNEIRREYWRNGGVDMEMVFGTEQRAEGVTIETRDKDGLLRYRQGGYAWIAYKTRNNFLEVPMAYYNFRYLVIDDEYNSGQHWPVRGEGLDNRERLAMRTDRVGDIFWTMNQAFIHLYDTGDGNLKVQLETVTPNFKSFRVSLDNGEWIDSGAVLSWELHSGQNFFKARAVNKFGIEGPEHKVVLLVK